jgi:BA14K-like protein
MPTWKVLPVGALALALGLTPVVPAAAASPLAPGLAKADVGNAVTQVDHRYGHRHYRHRGRNIGGGVAIGLGLGIIGGMIASEAYRPRPGYYYDDEAYDGPYYAPSGFSGDPRSLCAQNFRSFEWNTGLYTTYSGEKRLCPYLR